MAEVTALELPTFKGRPGWEFTDLSRLSLDAFAPVDGGERRQIQLRDVRELPAGLALEARDVELGGPARRFAAALLQPLGLADGGQLSQWNLPSGAR